MKRLLFISLTLLISGSIYAQKATITGKTHFEKTPQSLVLYHTVDGERATDTLTLKKNGKFKFKTKVDEPALAMLMAQFEPEKEGERATRQIARFYLESGKTKIVANDDLADASVKGGKLQADYAALQQQLKPFNDKQKELGEAYQEMRKNKDEAGMEKISDEYEALSKKMDEEGYHKFTMEHLNSPIALYALEQSAGYDIDPSEVEPVFNQLAANVQNSKSGKAFAKRIEAAKKTAIGAMAMEFTQNDTLGKPVSLSDFKGKYLLIDFWASWCGPCRAENPNVVKAFNKYKDKNFTVLGVSLDQPDAKQAWLDAIHHDGLYWTQVSDLKFWDNEVAKMYGIRAIPQNFLLDPSGKIIAKNIRGEELEKKLNEVISD